MAGGDWYHPDLTADARRVRLDLQRRRSRIALGIPVAVTVAWGLYVTVAGHWPRVGANWVSTLTMVFGSFVAGSTPQGGGAVGFPVFTKGLGVPSDVARSFSLCIQTIGMGTATAVILVTRRLVEWRAVLVGTAVASTAFVVTLVTLGDRSEAFWPIAVPGAYVRVTFSLVLASMAFVMYLGTRIRIRKIERSLPAMNRRLWTGLVVAGALGGLTSALAGSGADVFVYLFVVVLFGLDPKVGVPSSVVVMAAVSVLGFVVLGLWHGQLDVTLSADTATVTAVGGRALAEPLAASRFDLFGLWLAAVPVVCWGAPIGSWVANHISTRYLLRFVIALAMAELVTTGVFLPELHRPGPLLAFAVIGLVVVLVLLYLLARFRVELFGLPGLDLQESLSPDQVDAGPGFEQQLRRPRRSRPRSPR